MPGTETRLKEIAAREGRDPAWLANSLLVHLLDEAESDFRETLSGIQRGRRAEAEGRSRPFSEYVADVMRRRRERTDAPPAEAEQIAA
jgi:predicted transcriptional regulator